jgi:hypothetical protein
MAASGRYSEELILVLAGLGARANARNIRRIYMWKAHSSHRLIVQVQEVGGRDVWACPSSRPSFSRSASTCARACVENSCGYSIAPVAIPWMEIAANGAGAPAGNRRARLSGGAIPTRTGFLCRAPCCWLLDLSLIQEDEHQNRSVPPSPSFE